VVTTVAAVWIPMAAELTPANVADHGQALSLRADGQPGRSAANDHGLDLTTRGLHRASSSLSL
jgi:hypothetical protein